ncbi:MAG: L,D-transpeptidase family protein [Verrucomicrobiota bacterium]
MKRGFLIAILLILAGFAVWLYRQFLRTIPLPSNPRTVEEVVAALGPAVKSRLEPAFQNAGLSYPPARITLLAYKAEKRLDLQAANASGKFRPVLSWPILAASGTAGPKLREGDCQVPEGTYRIAELNPNSRFHLSLRVNYPNADDIARANTDGRDLSTLGGDIMIHGGAASIGCLAIGDPAVEELFVLAALTGLDEIGLVIASCDLRENSAPKLP